MVLCCRKKECKQRCREKLKKNYVLRDLWNRIYCAYSLLHVFNFIHLFHVLNLLLLIWRQSCAKLELLAAMCYLNLWHQLIASFKGSLLWYFSWKLLMCGLFSSFILSLGLVTPNPCTSVLILRWRWTGLGGVAPRIWQHSFMFVLMRGGGNIVMSS